MPKAVDDIDEGLLQFATPRQLEIVEAIRREGSMRKACKALGMDATAARNSMARLREQAARAGYSPGHDWVKPVPPTHVARGVSTYYDADGKVRGQWVKADIKRETAEAAIREATAAFVADLPPLPAADPPADRSVDVIPWVQIGDAHIGMLAHADEVGENFDLKIVEAELLGCIRLMIEEMPPCERMVINDLGDMTHTELFTGKTAASGHDLDVDGRYPKMLRTYSRVMRGAVDAALTKARYVDVIINQGNHSRVNDLWMRELLQVAYGHTGRVNVINNDSAFIGYRMGNTFVMVHHGDKCPPERLVGVMTSDFRRDFGETDFHYIDTGHIHTRKVAVDVSGVQLESWNVLQTNDKWAHDAGYRSRRCLSIVLRSRTYGEIGRRVLSIQEVRDRIGRATGKRQMKEPVRV